MNNICTMMMCHRLVYCDKTLHKYNACKLRFEGKLSYCLILGWNVSWTCFHDIHSLKWPIDADWKILIVITKERIKRSLIKPPKQKPGGIETVPQYSKLNTICTFLYYLKVSVMGLKINKAYKLETHLHKLIIVHHITTRAILLTFTNV